MLRIVLTSDPAVDNHGHDEWNPTHIDAQQVCTGDAATGIWFKVHSEARELFMTNERIQEIVYIPDGKLPHILRDNQEADQAFIDAWKASRGSSGRIAANTTGYVPMSES